MSDKPESRATIAYLTADLIADLEDYTGGLERLLVSAYQEWRYEQGRNFEYAASIFLEELFEHPGSYSIDTSHLDERDQFPE